MDARTSGPCICCKKWIKYGKLGGRHKKLGDIWLDLIIRKWKTPPNLHRSRSGKNIKVNGYLLKNLRSYLCSQCLFQYGAMISARDQSEKRTVTKQKSNQALRAKERNLLRAMPYQEYLQTDYWKQVCKAVRKRDGYCCKRCGSKKELTVHHEQYVNRGNELKHLDDLVLLCWTCHQDIHGSTYHIT